MPLFTRWQRQHLSLAAYSVLQLCHVDMHTQCPEGMDLYIFYGCKQVQPEATTGEPPCEGTRPLSHRCGHNTGDDQMCTKGASPYICYAGPGPDWPVMPSTARIMLDVSTAHDLECMTGADELVSQHAQLQTMPARRPKLPLVEFHCNDGVVPAGWACPSNKALMALVQH